jgi:hypothetical protein
MVRVLGAALLLGLVSLGACSGKTVDDDGAGGDSGMATPPVKKPPKPSPVVQCQTYASTWCNKALGCYVQVGRLDEGSRQSNVDQCTQLIVDHLPCSAATGTGDDFDKCISQVKGMACSKWNVPQVDFATVVPPAVCDNALSFE